MVRGFVEGYRESQWDDGIEVGECCSDGWVECGGVSRAKAPIVSCFLEASG